MGNNIDLVWLLGLPIRTNCKRCQARIQTNFEDYDIDCGKISADDNSGYLVLKVQCHECDYEFLMHYKAVSRSFIDKASEVKALIEESLSCLTTRE